jgi:ABC-type polysaccharide/polyol phosphate export permease
MNIFKELYKYRELLKSNTKKEVRGKYKHSFLGVLWSFLNPLLQILVYAIVFPLILKNNQEHYVVFLCCGLIPWNFFATAINRSASTMLENGNIIKKVYFPREILPISIVTSEAINFIISTIIILAFVLIDGIKLTPYILYYPLILLVQYLLILAISFVVSSVTVYIRDIQHLIGVALQLFFYATPIVYATDMIPEGFNWVLKLNPMTYVINGYRDIFLNQSAPDVKVLMLILVVLIGACALGYAIFHKLQKGFAEEL